MLNVDWEEKLHDLLPKGVKGYPLTAPLEAEQSDGHLVYIQISEEVFNSYEGDFVDNILLSLDVRSKEYLTARDLLRDIIDGFKTRGRGGSRFLVEQEPLVVDYDNVTFLYRFLMNVRINPYYQPPVKQTGLNRAFSPAFSPAFA